MQIIICSIMASRDKDEAYEKKTTSSDGRKRRNISDKEKEIIKQHRIRRAQASIKAGTEFMKKNAPTIAAATVTVALTGAHMGMIAPLASAAVSTSMNTVAAASKAAKEYDAKVDEKKQQ